MCYESIEIVGEIQVEHMRTHAKHIIITGDKPNIGQSLRSVRRSFCLPRFSCS